MVSDRAAARGKQLMSNPSKIPGVLLFVAVVGAFAVAFWSGCR